MARRPIEHRRLAGRRRDRHLRDLLAVPPPGGPVPDLNTAWDCLAKRGVFNTYTLEWTASRLTILVNGETCLVNRSADPAFQKPYIVALTQMLGTTANAYDGRASLPATITVDDLKIWK